MVLRQMSMPKQTEHIEGLVYRSRPPISKIEGIFIDLTEKEITINDLNNALIASKSKRPRVASTCSGTNAPIIRL